MTSDATTSDATTSGAPAGLFRRMRPLILAGLAAAAVRFALDCARLDAAMWIGVYYVLPVALLVAGIRGTYDDLKWLRLARGMLLVALCCWFVPNAVSYTTGQFLGWQHGRFAPGRTAPIAETAGMKVLAGLMVGGGTTVAGSLWLIVASTLLVWIPGRVRASRRKG
jgi:hypothetical protein